MWKTIDVGSKLKKRDAPDFILEVVELLTPRGDLPHARARVSISDRDLGVRLYAVSALEDSRLFILIHNPVSHHESYQISIATDREKGIDGEEPTLV